MNKYILLLSLFAIISGVDAHADNADNGYSLEDNDSIKGSYKSNEIVITAFKSNDDIATQPISASVLLDDVIRNCNMLSVKDITAYVPSFFMPDYGSKLTSPVYIRGIGSRTNNPSVGLYLDGVPYFDRSSFDFDMDGIERIEILRGPQGSLYGRNTMGGVINAYSKSPFSRRQSSITASLGSYDNYRLGASHINNVNGVFGYSISGNYNRVGGYFENKYTGKMADDMDVASGRVRLGWQMAHNLKAYLTFAYEYSDQNGYPYGMYNADNTVNDVNYNEQSFYRRHMSNNGLTVEYRHPEFLLSSQSSFQYLDGKQGIDQDFKPLDQFYVSFTHRQRMYSQEFNLKSIGNKRYNWVFGAFGFYQDYGQGNDIEFRQLNKETITDVSNPILGGALYHQSTINSLFFENLSFIFGLRYDWEKNEMENNSKSIEGGNTTVANPVEAKSIYNQFSPKFALQYKLTDTDMLYFSATRGYKSGGFNTTVENKKDRIFEPEYSWSYELGSKFDLFDGLVTTDVSVYYIDWINQQISQKRVSEQGFRVRNAGKSVSKGFEITSDINPLKNLNFRVSYGYTHAKFEEYMYDEAGGVDYGNNFLPLVPRNTLSAGVNYVISVKRDWLDEIKIHAQYAGVGSLYWSDDNKSSQPYYNTVNGQISFVRSNVSADIWAKNITNEKYITYYFESMGSKFAQRNKPFTIGMNVNVKF